MNASFVKRVLQVTLALANDKDGSASTKFNGDNAKTFNGLRVECEITKSLGVHAKNKAVIKIYGMPEDDMNALTTLAFQPLAVNKNLIQVEAGDLSGGMSVAFKGEITNAWAQYSSPPNLYFHVEALNGYFPSILPVKPSGYPGARSVSSIMKDLAAEMNYEFEDNGVKSWLIDQYLPGTAFQKATVVAAAADIEWGIDDDVLFIAPLGRPRGGNAALISPSTGLKEYPVFDKKGLKLECLYNPAIRLNGPIKVQDSAVLKANTDWIVNGLKHHLECEKPGGKWFTSVTAHPNGSQPTTPTDSTGEEVV